MSALSDLWNGLVGQNQQTTTTTTTNGGTGTGTAATPAKSNTTTYIIIGFVLVALIAVGYYLFKPKKA